MLEKNYAELTLTERQTDVLKLLSQGWSNLSIAAALHLSYNGVRSHIRLLYVKFDLEFKTKYDKRLKLALIGKEMFNAKQTD